jgi:hypothetical protein
VPRLGRHAAERPRWRDNITFNEHFHGDDGAGLGATHQTGWTGLLANLVERKYRRDIPAYWRQQQPEPVAPPRAAAVGS